MRAIAYDEPTFCFFCGSQDLHTGYGLEAGPLGIFTTCHGCGQLVGFAPDYDGLAAEDAAHLRELDHRLQTYLANSRLSWRRREEIIGLRALLSLIARMPTLDEAGVKKVREQIARVQQTWNTKGDCI